MTVPAHPDLTADEDRGAWLRWGHRTSKWEPMGVISIGRRLADARERIVRVEVDDLADMLSAGAILVDIRPESDRRQGGHHPDALVIERNVLE